ncbi:MAG: hypothetical protein HFF60_12625 [Oscillospiraceae bacterium]|nr:hypothetical protein [Oscillospiraceae bacterium]
MKKLCIVFFAALLLSVTASAVDVYVDGSELETDVPAQIVDGRTMVPLAPIFKALGANVTWDNATKTATGGKDGVSVQIQIGNKTAYVNGQPVALDVPAQIINGRTMVPLAFISQVLGADVFWDYDTSSARIVTKLYPVLRVVSGDTIVVNRDGVEETVRLIGVDAPEIMEPVSGKHTDAGFAASEYVTIYLSDEQVELELDVQERDQDGRLLAYVYSEGEMLNKKLLKTGYAALSSDSRNVKHMNEFKVIVSNRDPSIPSKEFYDGYMKAPKVIYNTLAIKNQMAGTFLYAEGKITALDKIESDGSEYPCLLLETDDGSIVLLDNLLKMDFDSYKIGDFLRIGFIYYDYFPEEGWAGGIFVETLDHTSQNTYQRPTTSPNTSQQPSSTNRPGSTQSSNASNRQTVYVTRTGKKYHYSSTCNGGSYYPSTLSDALNRGLTPCNKCAR